jgi:biopolymer transport protein ExbD
MAAAVKEAEGGAMMEINTTPLIDIMLVLLIMFLVTIPVQTHSVKVDLPQPRPGEVNPVKNKVVVDRDGTILWNGAPATKLQLRQYLDISARMAPAPELHLQPHPQARYETVDEVLAITKRAKVEAMGFVGNEAYARF